MTKKIRFFIILLVIIFIGIISLNFYFKTPSSKYLIDENTTVKDFFPKETMVKEFSGGYEDQECYYTIDKIDKDKLQMKAFDTLTQEKQALVLQASEDSIKILSIKVEYDGKFDEDYLESVKPNCNQILLKAPLKVGTHWNETLDTEYKITGINVKTKTPAGSFYTVEVTVFSDGVEEGKIYYAKGLGTVKKVFKKFEGTGEETLVKVEYK